MCTYENEHKLSRLDAHAESESEAANPQEGMRPTTHRSHGAVAGAEEYRSRHVNWSTQPIQIVHDDEHGGEDTIAMRDGGGRRKNSDCCHPGRARLWDGCTQ